MMFDLYDVEIKIFLVNSILIFTIGIRAGERVITNSKE